MLWIGRDTETSLKKNMSVTLLTSFRMLKYSRLPTRSPADHAYQEAWSRGRWRRSLQAILPRTITRTPTGGYPSCSACRASKSAQPQLASGKSRGTRGRQIIGEHARDGSDWNRAPAALKTDTARAREPMAQRSTRLCERESRCRTSRRGAT